MAKFKLITVISAGIISVAVMRNVSAAQKYNPHSGEKERSFFHAVIIECGTSNPRANCPDALYWLTLLLFIIWFCHKVYTVCL